MPGTLQGQLFGKNRFRQRFQSSCHQIPYRFGVGRLGIFTAMAIAQDAVPDGIRFELLLPVYIIHLQRVDPVLAQISYPTGIESLIISGVVKMERIHLGINALISGSMLSSRDQCSHLGINALISGSWRRPTEARTCSDDAPAPQRNGALPPHSETRRQNHPRTESGKLRPLCAI